MGVMKMNLDEQGEKSPVIKIEQKVVSIKERHEKTARERQQELVRKINVEALAQVLHNIAMDESVAPASRIAAASKLLDKVVPNLQSVETNDLTQKEPLSVTEQSFLIMQLAHYRSQQARMIDVTPKEG